MREYYNTPRLYVNSRLEVNKNIVLSKEQSHYLCNVMRKDAGDLIRLFNSEDGEYLAEIINQDKKSSNLYIKDRLRTVSKEIDLWLIFAPVKNARIGYIFEKATELGVSKFVPVKTNRTIVNKLNYEKIEKELIEAAEQSERLTIPVIEPIQNFERYICEVANKNRKIIFCDESLTSANIGIKLPQLAKNQGYAILVGPEGGFTKDEMNMLYTKDYIIPVTLGPRILRVDTAIFSALTCFQAILGDW